LGAGFIHRFDGIRWDAIAAYVVRAVIAINGLIGVVVDCRGLATAVANNNFAVPRYLLRR
jgi:hypothetical protein